MSNATYADFRKILTLYALLKDMIGKKPRIIVAIILVVAFLSQNLPILFAKTLTISKHSPVTISKDKKNIKSKSKAKSKSVKAKYQNGNVNDQIQISEIFPNPKGKDGNNEWIELYNPTDESTNLGNWQIIQHDTVKASKAKTLILPDTLNIPSKSYLILSNGNLKFTLKNKNNLVELKNFNDKTVDAIKYEKSSENLSFARIIVKKDGKFKIIRKWVKPSKDSKNPILKETNNLANKNQVPQKTGKKIKNENWLYFSLIPAILLIFLLKKTFRRHGVVNNLGNIGSG